MAYAKIINKGECFSSLNLNVNGIPANRNEWAKYNFYPKNDMVGVVMNVNGYIILKISDRIYIPMSPNGIQYISEAEYKVGISNNICNGMDERQQNLNNSYNSFQQQNMPALKEAFKQDIRRNIERKTVDFKRNIYIWDLIDEAVYYAADVCLEYYAKANNNLPQYWIDHIVNEVCAGFIDFFSEQFTMESSQEVYDRVNSMMTNKFAARKSINEYYTKVNQYYAEHF